MVTGRSCRGLCREDAWVRRARYCPESGRGRPGMRPDRVPDDEAWGARVPPRPVEADDSAVSAGDP